MNLLILMIVLVFAALVARQFMPKSFMFRNLLWRTTLVIGLVAGGLGGFSWNDAGYCQHIRTLFGTESMTCKSGPYFSGWGRHTGYPFTITIAHTDEATANGSSVSAPYPIKMADNWTGDAHQVTRFNIPKDAEQFIAMANEYRSPESLVNNNLRPSVTAALDSVANMFTMEAYYTSGARDTFKTEFPDSITKGRPRVRQVVKENILATQNEDVAPNDSENARDTSESNDAQSQTIVMEKMLDKDGNPIRIENAFNRYGITVSSAILEKIDPDTTYEEQIKKRKEASSRRSVAREQRLEQEEQRLLAITQGETDKARRQAEMMVEQIEQTTQAETKKQLALINAERQREEANIQRDTATIQLEKAKIDAEAKQVAADAEAYQKRVVLEADGALSQKLDAFVATQKVWADAASKIKVPSTVIAGGGAGDNSGNALGTVSDFMQIMTMNAAKQLQFDPAVQKVDKK
ncbi:SPFH domain-containing protein [Salipiger sp. PrR003]|uniref:SPFH domain-containing protein n=1 Tax=Salipiger sp. PrR003 TaxID=2706776 RepID=UPI0013DA6A6E|nr:SPFH domain-containing protein [Salipiger sp. PrR003]NDV50396.1 hypothetical protein [Salipiger sp. PrR003]